MLILVKAVIYGKSTEITPTVATDKDNAKATFAINSGSIVEDKLDSNLKGKNS